MQANIFTLCDFAQIMDNKLIIIGTFDYIGSREQFPINIGFMVAARLHVQDKDIGKHQVSFELRDTKHQGIAVREMDINVSSLSVPGEGNVQIFAVFPGVKILTPGRYTMHLHVDGKQITEIALHVVKH